MKILAFTIIVLLTACNEQKPYEVKITNYDDALAQAKKTKLMLDTQLLIAKFNSLEISAIAGMVKYRNSNRDSLLYYIGKADAFIEGRKIIYK